MSKKYDYIIAGAGLAGLSLAYRIRKEKKLDGLRILLLDRDQKNKNDRTWCFWSQRTGVFDHLIHKRWPKIRFASQNLNKSYSISPYDYRMIRGIDFYTHCFDFLTQCPNTFFINDTIENIEQSKNSVTVNCSGQEFECEYLFKSYPEPFDTNKNHFVWQHFKGWFIETANDSFDTNEATFMDFRVRQEDETRFFYVLPTTEKKALIELAVFSKEIPDPSFYDPFLKEYIEKTLGIKSYSISEVELGAIPMTNQKFSQNKASRIINTGTNAGQVKASSGFAFIRIQREMQRLFEYIRDNKVDQYLAESGRYQFYDSIFLNSILTGKTTGETVFEKLFNKISPQNIFRFLDEEGGFINDLKIFTAPPTIPFIHAFFEELLNKIK
ncbi:MAG: lycopene cyclase [Saprospiraceae bacterium]|nr:lycopene cyclase [Saprospiraceae bacterium]